MTKSQTIYLWPLIALLTLISPLGHAADPSATVVIDETQIMLLVGGDSGKGTIISHKNGESRRFKVSGAKLGGVGVHQLHMTGSVYHLNNIKDFEGTYFVAEAGITLVKGAGGMWLSNSNGVTMNLKSGAEGVALSLGVEGFKVKFVK